MLIKNLKFSETTLEAIYSLRLKLETLDNTNIRVKNIEDLVSLLNHCEQSKHTTIQLIRHKFLRSLTARQANILVEKGTNIQIFEDIALREKVYRGVIS